MGNSNVMNENYIFLDIDVKDQKDAFKFIAKNAVKMGISDDAAALVKGFEKREAEGTTGFEDGFAIPHARIKEVKQAAVFVVRFKKAIDWQAMDGQPTKIAIALMIPDGPNGDEHLSILSDIAIKLMNEYFKKTLKTSKSIKNIMSALSGDKKENKLTKTKTETDESGDKTLNVLAITACITGVAHTYMAEEKLLQEVPKMGYNIRVETHGSKGVGGTFTQSEIDNADLVIFATDINVDNSRFAGKKFYQVKVARAIKDPQGLVKEAIENGTILAGKGEAGEFNTNKSKNAPKDAGVLKHIMAGISYMIPAIILGGICLAFSIGIAKIVWGVDATPAGLPIIEKWTDADGKIVEMTVGWTHQWSILNGLNIIGGAAFMLMIPILAGFIANSIAGRAAIAPAMIGALIGNTNADFMPIGSLQAIDTPTGFIGALIAGLLVGYFVKWVNTWKVPRALQAAMPIFFIPLIAGIGISLIFIYVIGGPIGWVMHQVSWAIQQAYLGNVGIGVGLALGILLGAMAGFDMGGPINKIAFITCSLLVTNQIYQPMGAMAAAIPVAPISMGLSTIFFKKFFTKDEQGLGIAALIMGCIGISEGAIPFAIRDPRRAILSNVIGSAVAGAIAGAFGVQDYAAHGGPIVAVLGAVPYGLSTLYFFIAIIVGVATTTAIYGAWMLWEAGAPGSVKERHVAYLNSLRDARKENIETINEEKAKVKADFKENFKDAKKSGASQADLDKMKFDYKAKLEEFKVQIEKENESFKNKKDLADGIFKANSSLEKTYVKENSNDVKQTLSGITSEKREELSTIKEDIQNVKANENLTKYEKEVQVKALKEKSRQIIEEAKEKELQTQVELRIQYVQTYEKELGL